jgi:hypothetical protein
MQFVAPANPQSRMTPLIALFIRTIERAVIVVIWRLAQLMIDQFVQSAACGPPSMSIRSPVKLPAELS